MPAPLARVVDVEKRFGDLLAVKSASCVFEAGKIHAVCGENGAGKSTLLKLVSGILIPDAGRVDVAGSPLSPHTPREAIRRGVGMVLQHFALVPVFTALENIVLGAEPRGMFGSIDARSARVRAERVARELGIELPLDEPVESLGVGDRQRLEIARALFRDASLLILDEPTAVLTKNEATALYRTLRGLADAGKGIVVVTHKMDEVRAFAEVVTVMRRGEVLFTRPIDRGAGLDRQIDEVTASIMGAAPGAPASRNGASAARGEAVLRVRDVKLGRALSGVTLEVASGEIVGIAGVEGNGQHELAAILGGDVTPDAGAVEGGPVALVREDRQTEGLVLDATTRDNLVLGELGAFARRGGFLDLGALDREASARLERSGAPKGLDRAVRTLSGGNQQKIVLARALARIDNGSARVLVAAQPTRGIDLAASREVHARLKDAAAKGAGVLLMSADLDELRALANRILVLARGRVVGELAPSASDEELGRLMLGVGAAPPAASDEERSRRRPTAGNDEERP